MSTSLAPANTTSVADMNALNRQVLTFILGKEIYGLDILKVQEIRGWSDPTCIPNAPSFIRGVINLRGAIVPILDLRNRFAMDDVGMTKSTVVIVVSVQTRTVGMMVDAVSDVVDLSPSDIRPAPDFGTSIDSSFITGLVPHEDKMIILLAINDMLAASDLLAVDNAAQAKN